MYKLLAILILLLSTLSANAQDNPPPATIINDEGGTQVIRGSVSYTYAFFTAGVSEPLIIMEDQTGFITRDRGFVIPPEAQIQGQIITDFYTTPFEYTLQLPLQPQAFYNDVDQDAEEDTGVQVFAIAYWTNIWGPSFLEERDQYGGGWSNAYVSTRVSTRSETQGEVYGGKYLIYAPDDEQGFPSGFGEDGMLFTEDDPIVTVPAGYTLVDMDTDPFTFDRSREISVDLIEGEGSEADDFSALSYTEAFDAMVEKFRKEYAYTEYKNLDWDALSDTFRPRIEAAEADNDSGAYQLALRDFLWSIPDGHVYMSMGSYLQAMFQEETSGGIGLDIRELDDGRIIAFMIVENSPADEAGIEERAEIIAINGQPISDYVSEVVPWSSPFSAYDPKRLQQLRYATRFIVDSEVEVTYRNPGDDEDSTATLTAIPEVASFNNSSFLINTTGFELPVEYEPIPGTDFVLVRITDFMDNERLTIDLWERLMTTLYDQATPGIIIDMRNNGGGSGWLAIQMAAYFFDEPLLVGNGGSYDEDIDDFYFDPNVESRMILPPANLRYDGEIAVLVGPNCNSACEFFSYYMTLEDRATVVGQYTSGGLGGGVDQFYMPDGINVQITIARQVDADGNIHLEGIGVVPDVKVPVTEETLYSDGDPVLEAAIDYMDDAIVYEYIDVGSLTIDEPVTGEIAATQRLLYEVTLPGDIITDIRVMPETEGLRLMLYLYTTEGDLLLVGESLVDTAGAAILAELDTEGTELPVLLEIATIRDEGEGSYTLEMSPSE